MPADAPEARFGIAIDTQYQSAEDAAKSLERLREKIDADTRSLREMQSALRRVQGSTSANVNTIKALKDQIAAKKEALGSATEKLVGMRGAFDKLKPATEKQGQIFAALTERVGFLRATVGGVLSPTTALVAALVAVAAAAVFATTKLLEFGLAAADARRSEALLLGAAGASLFWGQATAAAGIAIQRSVDLVSSGVAIAREKVADFATQLAEARLSGQQLTTALEAVSIAASAGKDSGGLLAAFAGIRYAGGSVDALAKRVKQQFGGVVRAQMLSLTTQSMKLRENISLLFRDINIDPFLTGLHEILELFSTSTTTGYALRTALTNIFKALEGPINFIKPIAIGFFKGLVIAGLQVTVWFLKLRNAIRDALPPGAFAGFDGLKAGMYAGIVVGGLLLGTLALIGVTLAAAFAPIAVVGGLLYAVISIAKEGISAIGDAFVFVKNLIAAAGYALGEGVLYLAKLDWGNLGSNLIDGLVNGIKNGASKVVTAVKNMASGAADAFTGFWGIHSPSTRMREYGQNIGEGGQVGIERSAPGLQSALDEAIAPPSRAPRSGSDTATAAGSAGPSFTFGNINITVGPGAKAEEAKPIAKAIGDAIAAELEAVVQMFGGKLANA